MPFALALLILLVAAPAAPAQGTIDRSRHLWSTVNICDTQRHPDTFGVRASMPGSGRRKERMFMRFRAQYRAEDGTWRAFTSTGTNSGFVLVGSGRFKARQSGWTFPFQPEVGQRFELRGVVNYEWRRGDKRVRRATKATTTGHHVTVADPEGYSAATCEIVG